jgi:hypothetical protein
VPLLRTGFRPAGPYTVTFVFMHAGAPFAKKGDSELSLPQMDIPISLLQWEVFLPERYKVQNFGGNAISTALLPPSAQMAPAGEDKYGLMEQAGAWPISGDINIDQLLPGQMGGIVVDATGAALPGAEISIINVGTGSTITGYTNQAGRWIVSNVPSGTFKAVANLAGFQTQTYSDIRHDARRSVRLSFQLQIRKLEQQVEVSILDAARLSQQIEREAEKISPTILNAASVNVVNLQRRAAGDLPVRVDVPRTGGSFRFVRPLVLDEETKVTFRYKSK